MSEPKRGKHDEICMKIAPTCLCNTCQNDGVEPPCCRKRKTCYAEKCKLYIKDEPTKKGAANV